MTIKISYKKSFSIILYIKTEGSINTCITKVKNSTGAIPVIPVKLNAINPIAGKRTEAA